MEALSNADRFVILLRQKLAERARVKTAGPKQTGSADAANESRAKAPIAELTAQAGADDRTLRRTIVEQLLTDRLGVSLANEPRFQQVVDRISAIISSDEQLGPLLDQIMIEVRH